MEAEQQQPSSSTDASTAIASEQDLEAFSRLPAEERVLSDAFRGVLAETAKTGRIRYRWPVLKPLVEFTLEQVPHKHGCIQEVHS